MSWDWEKLKQQQQQHRGGTPPQVDEILQKLKTMKFRGGPLVILALILIFFASSMFFTVKQDEVGIVQRFGRYVRTAQPGLGFKLPTGIERVTKVNVTRVETAEFGFRSSPQTSPSRLSTTITADTPDSLMLTGDLNVAVVPWIVQYRVKDPFNFLFKVQDPKQLLQDMAEAAMRLVVGDRSIDEVISKREEIAVEARTVLQTELDQADSGIHIVTIELQRTNVPGPVQPSFNEVNQATQEKEQMIYRAREDYNKAIPAARGEAERTIRAAEGYALDRINRAEGDATRFTAQFTEYAKAKDVTKRRLYLETIREVFPKFGSTVIIDSDQKNVLPLLNLGKEGGVVK
ncbi:MAG: FtsH protease activity modulator HflK [Desulfobacterales bacterium]